MAAVTLMWSDSVFQSQRADGCVTVSTTMSYADNWETVDENPASTLCALQATKAFCDKMLMTRNANKS